MCGHRRSNWPEYIEYLSRSRRCTDLEQLTGVLASAAVLRHIPLHPPLLRVQQLRRQQEQHRHDGHAGAGLDGRLLGLRQRRHLVADGLTSDAEQLLQGHREDCHLCRRFSHRAQFEDQPHRPVYLQAISRGGLMLDLSQNT